MKVNEVHSTTMMRDPFLLRYYRRKHEDFSIKRIRYIFRPSLPVIAIRVKDETLIVNLCPEPILSLLYKLRDAKKAREGTKTIVA